jgi:DNA-3-methyladenine glycosylase I
LTSAAFITESEIVNEFLMSAGYLAGAHIESCAVYKKVVKAKPTFAAK